MFNASGYLIKTDNLPLEKIYNEILTGRLINVVALKTMKTN